MDETDELIELSPRRRLWCNLTAALAVVLAGLFLLLCGLNVFPVRVGRALCGTLLCTVGVILFLNAVIGRNSVSLWLSVCFLLPALVELLVKTTAARYTQLYPLYIAIPAVASAVCMCFTREWAVHLPVVALFGVPAGIFALKSGGVASWSVVVPVLVIYVGLLMLALALKLQRKDKDNER